MGREANLLRRITRDEPQKSAQDVPSTTPFHILRAVFCHKVFRTALIGVLPAILVVPTLLLSQRINMRPLLSPLEYLDNNPCSSDDRTSGKNGERIPVVVLLGDSLTHGHVGADWVSPLRKRFSNLTLLNAGLNSQLAYGVWRRLDTEVFPTNPQTVILLIGSNDAMGSFRSDNRGGNVYFEGSLHSRFLLPESVVPQLPSREFYRTYLHRTLARLKGRRVVPLEEKSERTRADKMSSVTTESPPAARPSLSPPGGGIPPETERRHDDDEERAVPNVAILTLPPLGEVRRSPANDLIAEMNEDIRHLAESVVGDVEVLDLNSRLWARWTEMGTVKSREEQSADVEDSITRYDGIDAWRMFVAPVRYYVLGSTWREVSEVYGYRLLAGDGVHFNEDAAEVIEDLVAEYLTTVHGGGAAEGRKGIDEDSGRRFVGCGDL